MANSTYMGMPREEIPWYLIIDPDKCANCGACMDFCPNDVFEQGGTTMIVANKYNCVVGCDKCFTECDYEALPFPSKEELLDKLKELREKYRKS